MRILLLFLLNATYFEAIHRTRGLKSTIFTILAKTTLPSNTAYTELMLSVSVHRHIDPESHESTVLQLIFNVSVYTPKVLTVIRKTSEQQSSSDRVDNTARSSKPSSLVDEEDDCQRTKQQSNAYTSY